MVHSLKIVIIGLFFSLSMSSYGQLIEYEKENLLVYGQDCPLTSNAIVFSDYGREIKIKSTENLKVGFADRLGGLIESAQCIFRIPIKIRSRHLVHQINQELYFSYAKVPGIEFSVYGNARVIGLDFLPIKFTIDDNNGMTQQGRAVNSVDTENFVSWCQTESEPVRSQLIVTLSLTALRESKSQTGYIQLLKNPHLFKARLETSPCGAELSRFKGNVGKKLDTCLGVNSVGLTCSGVGLHSPQTRTCYKGQDWACQDDGCAALVNDEFCRVEL